MSNVSFYNVNSNLCNFDDTPYDPASCVKKPLFGKPIEIGYFSISADRKIHFDKRHIKYLVSLSKTKNLDLDLNDNYNHDVQHEYVTIEKMSQILYWLKFNPQGNLRRTDLFIKKPSVDFVTVRGALAKVMCTPYGESKYNKWEICASKLNNVIYFSAIDSDEDIEKNSDPKMKVFQSWGYKFEQYMTSDQMNGSPDLENATHRLEEFDVVLKNVLNKHSLVYKAEMDAVIPYRRSSLGVNDTSCYTELKTYKIMTTLSEKLYFLRYRAVSWWAQSYLAGVPDIIRGNRTNDGFVKSINFLKVSSLAEDALGLWSTDVCLDFCDKFLTFLKKTVVEDDIRIVYKFQYKGDGTIYCSKLVNPEKRYIVIPDWYGTE